jgi:hypothetical protein
MSTTGPGLLCVVACASISATHHAAAPRALEIGAGGRVVWRVPIAVDERFELSFVHSQERTLWTQHYFAGADARIWQDASTFGAYGAGMPDGRATRSAEGFTVRVNRRLSSIAMMNSRAAELRLRYRGHTFALDRWFADYERFEIRVR